MFRSTTTATTTAESTTTTAASTTTTAGKKAYVEYRIICVALKHEQKLSIRT